MHISFVHIVTYVFALFWIFCLIKHTVNFAADITVIVNVSLWPAMLSSHALACSVNHILLQFLFSQRTFSVIGKPTSPELSTRRGLEPLLYRGTDFFEVHPETNGGRKIQNLHRFM